jgi:hypothetical protein
MQHQEEQFDLRMIYARTHLNVGNSCTLMNHNRSNTDAKDTQENHNVCLLVRTHQKRSLPTGQAQSIIDVTTPKNSTIRGKHQID